MLVIADCVAFFERRQTCSLFTQPSYTRCQSHQTPFDICAQFKYVSLVRALAGAKYCNQFVHNVHNVLNWHWPSLLAAKWPDRHQTCTRWSPGKSASTVCSRSRSRSKVTWYGHFCTGTNIASWGLLGYVELFIIRVILFLAFQYSSPGGSTTAGEVCYLRLLCFSLKTGFISSFQWANAMARRPSSVRPYVNVLRKSLLLAGKWLDRNRHQTCTRWSPEELTSRVCSSSRSRWKVTW